MPIIRWHVGETPAAITSGSSFHKFIISVANSGRGCNIIYSPRRGRKPACDTLFACSFSPAPTNRATIARRPVNSPIINGVISETTDAGNAHPVIAAVTQLSDPYHIDDRSAYHQGEEVMVIGQPSVHSAPHKRRLWSVRSFLSFSLWSLHRHLAVLLPRRQVLRFLPRVKSPLSVG